MSVLDPTTRNITWVERPIRSDALPLVAKLIADGAGFVVSTEGEQAAAQVDIDNNGIYKPLDLTDRLYFIDVAGIPTLSTTGTEAYILVDDGTGVLTLSTDLTQTPAAEAYSDGDGRYITTDPNGGEGLQLIAAGGIIIPFI